jgi:hypothetical protein
MSRRIDEPNWKGAIEGTGFGFRALGEFVSPIAQGPLGKSIFSMGIVILSILVSGESWDVALSPHDTGTGN